MRAASLMGLAVGLAAGAAAGLLTAPMRGTQMRASLRTRADSALDRSMQLLEDGRRALRARVGTVSATGSAPLTATLGEIADLHSTDELAALEARS
jgi:gas vesicle protein